MPVLKRPGYAPDALITDPDAGTLTLKADFNTGTDHILFSLPENAATGTDAAGFADGAEAFAGATLSAPCAVVLAPDGARITVERVAADGVVAGFVTSQPLAPGVACAVAEVVDISAVPLCGPEATGLCSFGPGTMIRTEDGEIPVEWLETSDRVLTKDNGYQPVMWIGRTRRDPGFFARNPDCAPLRIATGTIAAGVPTHDLTVTRDHPLLMTMGASDPAAGSEVLALAAAWADSARATPLRPGRSFTLTSILCADHQIIMAEGAWVGSMFAHPAAMEQLSPSAREAIVYRLGTDLHGHRLVRPIVPRARAADLIRVRAGGGETQGRRV
ncbi:Hint domain-containing protein [uncultured Roseobacter sp.]|uniref:Hint domain-containing protein n=1 Tax=uncultured Roseobacter sp. TaxID=114847 RepID=UPI00261FAD0A|nr:Hint domain-containing protein [uncultured Roseobacter sp.]